MARVKRNIETFRDVSDDFATIRKFVAVRKAAAPSYVTSARETSREGDRNGESCAVVAIVRVSACAGQPGGPTFGHAPHEAQARGGLRVRLS